MQSPCYHITTPHIHAAHLGNLFADEMGEAGGVDDVSRDVDQWNPEDAMPSVQSAIGESVIHRPSAQMLASK